MRAWEILDEIYDKTDRDYISDLLHLGNDDPFPDDLSKSHFDKFKSLERVINFHDELDFLTHGFNKTIPNILSDDDTEYFLNILDKINDEIIFKMPESRVVNKLYKKMVSYFLQ